MLSLNHDSHVASNGVYGYLRVEADQRQPANHAAYIALQGHVKK